MKAIVKTKSRRKKITRAGVFEHSRRAVVFLVLVLGLNASGLGAISHTFAYYNDTEISSGNMFMASKLDFALSAGEWEPSDDAMNLVSGTTVTRTMSVLGDGSTKFHYKVESVKTAGDDDFCAEIELKATRNASEIYNSGLLGMITPALVEIDADNEDEWLFEATMPVGAPDFDEAGCEFKFVVDGWQVDFPLIAGFNDHEELENILEVGSSNASGFSPIEDAFVNEDSANDNTGSSIDLKVKSQNSERDKRTFIRFDFHLPSGTTVLSSNLMMFMRSAPPLSRTYEARRAMDAWSEKGVGGITWNNQPGLGGVSYSTTTGAVDKKWLSWDVTSDVAAFVAGTETNNGWGVRDASEDSSTGQEAMFYSRDSGKTAFRPVLELSIVPPVVSTTHVVVNEVYYHVGSGKGTDSANEWVEIYNPTDSAVDITGWKICDNSSCDTIPATPAIPSHGFAVISQNATTWTKWTPPAEAVLIVLGTSIGGGLANTGDEVVLKNTADVEIDSMSYGSDTSEFDPAAPLSGKGKSLARIIKGYDNDVASDWIINATPNPGTNPSSSGTEVIRFTSEGVEVADMGEGLEDMSIDVGAAVETEEEAVVSESPVEVVAETVVEAPVVLLESPALVSEATSSASEASSTPEIIVADVAPETSLFDSTAVTTPVTISGEVDDTDAAVDADEGSQEATQTEIIPELESGESATIPDPASAPDPGSDEPDSSTPPDGLTPADGPVAPDGAASSEAQDQNSVETNQETQV